MLDSVSVKVTETGNSDETRVTPQVRDFAWSLATAVFIYRGESNLSPLQQHLFIMRWLTNAKKKRLLPKEAAGEIDWFIAEGRRSGPAAALLEKALYLWMAATGNFRDMSDLRRITRFFEAVRLMGWQDKIISDDDWERPVVQGSNVQTVWVRATDLSTCLDHNQNLTTPLALRLSHPWPGIALLAEDAFLGLEFHQSPPNCCEAIVFSERCITTKPDPHVLP